MTVTGTSCARAGGPESWLFSSARFCEGFRLSGPTETLRNPVRSPWPSGRDSARASPSLASDLASWNENCGSLQDRSRVVVILARSTCAARTLRDRSGSHRSMSTSTTRITSRHCRPRRRLRSSIGPSRGVAAHGVCLACPPLWHAPPGQEPAATRSEALAGNSARLPGGNAADAHARVLDHVRRGRRSGCHRDRATSCRFHRPAQRRAVEGPRHTGDAKSVLSAGRRSVRSSTRGSSRAR